MATSEVEDDMFADAIEEEPIVPQATPAAAEAVALPVKDQDPSPTVVEHVQQNPEDDNVNILQEDWPTLSGMSHIASVAELW